MWNTFVLTPIRYHALTSGGEGRYVNFSVMCTKRRKSLQTLVLGDVQVHINSDRPGTGIDCLRSVIRELGPWQGEVFQRPLVKAQQGFH